MALPMNDDVSNRELSINELDAIAAGSLWGWFKKELGDAAHYLESHLPHFPDPWKLPYPRIPARI